MTITTVMDPAAGGEEVSMEQDIGGVIKNTKGDNEISEDIGQLLPTEVSSAESDNFDDGDGEGNDFDQENENLLDEITEEDIRRSRNNNNDNYEGKDNFEAAGYQDRQPLSVIDNKKNNNTITNAPVGESCNNDKTEIDTKAQAQSQSQAPAPAQSQGNKEDDDDNGDADSNTSTTTSTAPSTSSTTSTSFRGRPSSCVFVASLAASLSDDELCISVTESFRQYGQLARVKVLRDPANRPYAFVQYTNDRDAKRALKMARGSMLNGRTLRCESARVNRTLFVTHVVNPVFYLEVANLCGKFGELEQLVPSSDQNQFGRRYNYPPSNNYSWFVQFAYRDDAIRAFANLRTNSDWDVEWVQNIEVPKYYNLLHKMKKQQQQQQNNTAAAAATSNSANDSSNRDKSISNENEFEEESEFGDNRDSFSSNTVGSNDDRIFIDKKSIFVGQLDQSVTREKLLERFSTHGEISDLNLINKTNKVFAFIQFETEEAAAAALERENHAIFLNKTMHVQYKEVGGHRSKRNFRRDNFYGNIRNIGPGFIHNNNHNNGNNSNNNNNNNNVGSIGSSGGGGNASTMGTNTIIPATSAAVAASIAASAAGHGNHTGGHGRMFTGPQVNLAPPPINMYKRRTQENDMPNMVPPFMAQQMPNPASEFDMNYVPYMNPGFRRKSSFINNGWSSSRSHSMKSDMDTVCGDGGTDATSDAPSESCGQMNSPTTCNDSSAGSMGHYDNNSSSNHGSDNSNNDSNDNNNGLNANSNNGHHNDYHNYNMGNGKRKYGKRGNNHRYHDTPKPYYFQPFYYHPMHYPMGPLGPVAPAHPSQAAAAAAAAAGNHPYMMIYPMPPPPPTGVEGNLLAQPLPLGPPGPMMRGSPPTSQSQGARSDVNEFVPNAKSCQLDY